jgi:hypothetical protein
MEFVTFEIAKKLKEKKFPQHWSDDDYIVENEYEDDFEVGCHYDRCFIPEHLPTIAAPTISQVLKWLREEKQLYVSIEYVPKIENCGDFYYTKIQYIGDFTSTIHTPGDYDSYEEAALAGIEYVLDNLI